MEHCEDKRFKIELMKRSSLLESEWFDLLVSIIRVTILLEPYRRKWQGGNIHIPTIFPWSYLVRLWEIEVDDWAVVALQYHVSGLWGLKN